MKPTSFPSKPRTLALVLLALAFWVSTVHGFMHHHHHDFERHGDCAICKVVGATAALPDSLPTGELPSELALRTPFDVPEAFGLSARRLRLRAPATSPPDAQA